MQGQQQLGRTFRRRRQELAATQVDVARAVGVTRQWLARVESGTGNPDLLQLLRLCEVLDLSLTAVPQKGLRGTEPAAPARRAARPAARRVEARAKPSRTTGGSRDVANAPRPAGLSADLDQLLSSHTHSEEL